MQGHDRRYPAVDRPQAIYSDGTAKTILMVEQNARKGLEFADIGYVLVSGRLVRAGPGHALPADPEAGRLFLGD